MASSSPHQRYVHLLMERVRRDEYPSTSDLDRIEQSVTTGQEVNDYLEYLFEKVETPRPSPQIMDRIERLLAMVPPNQPR
jgi:hypothetical protein